MSHRLQQFLPGIFSFRGLSRLPHDRRTRLIVACAVGAAAGLLCYALLAHAGPWLQANDFTYFWTAARAIARHEDPYDALHHAILPWQCGFTYPMPAGLLVLPLAWIPVRVAGCLFIALSFAALAYTLSATGYWRLAALMSGPAIQAIVSLQWSPLIMAAAFWPTGLGVVAAKPTIGLAMIAFQRRLSDAVRVSVVALGLGLVCLVLDPPWVSHWFANAFDPNIAGKHAIPLLHPLGWALGLALLRWRRPEARLLVVLALVPQKMYFYDQLLLLLVPETRRELAVAVILSQVAYAIILQFPWFDPGPGGATARFLPFVVIGLYWPALLMILRRPNRWNDDTARAVSAT